MNNLIGKNLTAGYGGVDIIKDINLEVNEGEIVVIKLLTTISKR